MHTFLRLTILLLLPVFASAEPSKIYKSIDSEGRVIYSDSPSDQAEVVELGQSSTYKPAPRVIKLSPPTLKVTSFDFYPTLAITSPSSDQAIRNNAGNLDLVVSLRPALRPGHRMVLLVDGQPSAAQPTHRAGKAVFHLTQLDRGTHQFQVNIVSNLPNRVSNQAVAISVRKRQPIKTSAPITITILRASVLRPAQ